MSAYAMIATGGTGGHVYPALALARTLVERGHDPSSIRFVGGHRLERDAVPEAGFAIDSLPGRGLRRRFTPENLVALAEAVVAVVRAVRLVRRHRPRVVVGFGGYASLPCVVAARLSRLPTVVHEQNAAPGLANRVAVRLGAVAAISLPDTALRGAVLTGNPVRPEIARVRRAPERPPIVWIVGGSLGARRLNDAALGLYERWRDRTDLRVRHVAGPRDHTECARTLAARRRPSDTLEYDLREYEARMEDGYAAAALAVCRAGASTVAELAVAGVPAVLVPLPGAPGGHQEANAARLAAVGAAEVVADDEADAAHLGSVVERLLAEPGTLERMGGAARTVARPAAAADLADLVEAAVGGAAA